MREKTVRWASVAVAASIALGAAGLAILNGEDASARRWSEGALGADRALWMEPAGEPVGLAVLAHGFARRCSDIEGLALRMARRGLAVVCPVSTMIGGDLKRADRVGAALGYDGVAAPSGRVFRRAVLVGHSAGGSFALRAASRMVQGGSLAGVVLIDPVAADAGAARSDYALLMKALTPTLSMMASASGCNRGGQARGWVLAGASENPKSLSLAMGEGSSHLDAEGAGGSALASALCGKALAARAEDVAWLASDAAVKMSMPSGADSGWGGKAGAEVWLSGSQATRVD